MLFVLFQVEEEEYTSRIIHYFISGLLTLPEGATLRSYLADKLNCDPMRITKKYAGASCLGRRVYHFRDRVHPTVAEIQVAKVELDHLEQRFRLRIEGGQTNWTPPGVQPSTEIAQVLSRQAGVPSDSASSGVPQHISTNPALQAQDLLQSILMGIGGNPASAPSGTTLAHQVPASALPASLFSFPAASGAAASLPPALSHLLAPNAVAAGAGALGVQS
jgi:hypothetical protein